MMAAARPRSLYGGVFCGHFHRFACNDAFDEWTGWKQWETDACKDAGAFSVFRVTADGRAVLVP
jgi:hypothetical protein